MANIQYDERKLGELILYVSRKSADDPDFGATKLNKILYFADFLAYGYWGVPITGAEYQHLPQGPAPRRLIPVRDQLVSEGALAIQEVQVLGGWTQKRTVYLREPNLESFRGREIALVDQVIDALRGVNATQASFLSHAEVGWKATRDGQTIEYDTVFLSDKPLSEVETRRVLQMQHAPQALSA